MPPLEPTQRGHSGIPLARVRVYRSTNQTIATATLSPILFDFRSYDTMGSMWQPGDPGKIILPSRGIYACKCHARWQASAAAGSDKAISITLGGSVIDTDNEPLDATVERSASCSGEFYGEAGQVLQMTAFQNSGGNLNLVAASTYGIYLQVFLLVPLQL